MPSVETLAEAVEPATTVSEPMSIVYRISLTPDPPVLSVAVRLTVTGDDLCHPDAGVAGEKLWVVVGGVGSLTGLVGVKRTTLLG